MKHTRPFSHIEPDGQMACDVCPQGCRFKEGTRGRCYSVKREGDELILTNYGLSSGFCVDPIEKKPLYHFLPGSPVLSFGTIGCNLACKFCQNWDISMNRQTEQMSSFTEPEAVVAAAKELNCSSIACTYNEPTIFLEYAMDVAQAAHAEGIKMVAVTNGYIHGEAREAFYRNMDAANVDLKGFTDRFYQELCGAHLQPVLDTLKYIHHETDTWLEITTLLIPGENDSDKELIEMCKWIVENLGTNVPLHFTAYHPAHQYTKANRTPLSTLTRARDLARHAGLRFVYTGNIYNPEGDTTYCPDCGEVLIRREGFELSEWNLDGNQCRFCDAEIPGVFADYPGTWGSKRLPVTM